jgi:hypothetical protein
MRIDDFVCLGRTVPEESKKYGRKVCMAGYSDEMREFIRIYPLPVVNPIHQRSVCRIEVSRPNHDSRDESWRLAREKENDGIEVGNTAKTTTEVVRWLNDHMSRSIKELNAARRSLGVVRPRNIAPYFRTPSQMTDPDRPWLPLCVRASSSRV